MNSFPPHSDFRADNQLDRSKPGMPLFVKFSSLLSVIVGLSGLAGCFLHILILRTFVPGMVAIAANTSLCLVFLGISLWFMREQNGPSWSKVVGRLAAAIAGSIGFLSLVEYLGLFDFGIDQLLFTEATPGVLGHVRPGLMSPITALNFTLLGFGLLLLDWTTRRRTWPSQAICSISGVIAIFTLIDLIVDPLHQRAHIAVPTVVVLSILPFAVICTRPRRALGGLFLAPPGSRRALLKELFFAGTKARGGLVHYAIAVLLVGAATTLRNLLTGYLDPGQIFLTYYPAVIFAVLLGGLGPGIVATILSATCANYYFLPPTGVFTIANGRDLLALLMFVAIGSAISWLASALDQTRTEAAAALIQRENELRQAQHVAHIGSWRWNAASDTFVWSDELYEIFGRDRKLPPPVYKEHLRYTCPEGSALEEAAVQNALKTGQAYAFDMEIVLEDGTRRWVSNRGAPDFDEEGRITGLHGTVQDITERKRAEEAAAKERKRFEAVLESLPAMICLLTPDYHVSFANKAFRDRFGESKGRRCYEYCYGKTEPCSFCESYKVLKTNAPHDWEIATENGRYIHAYDFPFEDFDGSPLILEMDVDVTEERRNEQRLKNASLYTRSLIEASLDPLVTISRAGKITDVNHATELVTGRSREQLIGSDFCDYFTEPDKARQGYEQVFSQGWVRDYPLAIRNGSGQVTDVLYNANVFRNETGEVEGVFAAARDITERKRGDEKLQRINRTLRTLSECTEVLMRATNEDAMLHRVCDTAVQAGGYRMAWVGYAEPDEKKTVTSVAEAGFEDGYLTTANISWADEERGRGPTGTAIRSGKAVVCNHTADDPEFAPWRKEALRCGYGASIALPLRSENETLGALMLYATEPDAFDSAEQQLLETLSNNMTYAILAVRARGAKREAEKRVAAEREKFNNILNVIPPYVILLTEDYRVAFANKEFVRRFGEDKGRRCYEFLFNRTEPCENCETYKVLKTNAPGYWEWTGPDGNSYAIYDLPYTDTDGTRLILEMGMDVTERKRAEEAVRESEQRYRSVVSAMAEGVVLQDASGKIIACNESAERILGLSADRIKGQTSDDWRDTAIHEDGSPFPGDKHPAMVTLRTGKSQSNVYMGLHKPDGNLAWILINSEPLFHSGEAAPYAAVTTFADITQRREMEENLRRTAEELKEAQRVGRSGSWTLDLETGVVSWTEEAFRMFGLDQSAGAPTFLQQQQLFTPESWSRLVPAVEKARNAGEPYELELETVLPDGHHGWILVRGEAVRTNGQITGLRGAILDITGRKQAELARQESERQFSTLADFVPQFVWMCTPDGLNFYFNRRWFEYTGLTEEESYGRGWNTPFHPDDKQAAWNAWNHATATGETYVVESRLRAADGSYRWFLMRGMPIRDEAGNITRWFGTSTDIDDMKRVEAQLAQLNLELERRVRERTSELETAHTRLAIAQKAAKAGMWNWDLVTGKLAWSPELFELFALPATEQPSFETWERVVHPADWKHAAATVELAITDHKPLENEFRIVLPGGQERWIRSVGNAAYDQNGAPQSMSGICLDITERKAAEAKLNEATRRFQTIVDHAPIAIYVKDRDGRFVFANRPLERLTGLSRERLIGMTDYDFARKEDADRWRENDLKVLAGQNQTEFEEHGTDSAGRRYVNLSVKFPLMDESGGPAEVCGISTDITAIKASEEALRDREELLRAVTENSPDAIYVKDRSSRWLMANPSVLRIVGRTAEEALGKTDLELYADPAIGQAILDNDRRIMETGAMEAFEEIADTPDGRRTFLSVKAPRRDAQGNVVGIVGISRDMTERKKAEAELERTRSLLAEGQRIAHVGTFEYVADTQTTVWSEEEYHIYGLDPSQPSPSYETLLAKSIHPDDAALLDRTFKAAVQNRSVYELEHRIVLPDGSLKWVYDLAYPYLNDDGGLVRYVGATLDITERKRAAEAIASLNQDLRRRAAELQTIFNTVPIGLGITNDPDGLHIYGNTVFEQMLGASTGDELSKSDPNSVPYRVYKDGREAVAQDLPIQRAAHGEQVPGQALDVVRPDGTRVVLYSSAAPLYDEQQHPRGAVGAFVDITEQKRVEHELKVQTDALVNANNELESFTYAVAHDLRAPLRHIHGFADLLAGEAKETLPKTAQQYLTRIQNGAEQMGHLLEDLLELSRLTRQEVRMQTCDLKVLVEEVISELQPDCKNRKIMWRIADLPAVQGDRMLLKHLLTNLISNSLKFTGPRPVSEIEVGVTTTDEGEEALFVRDNGVGFDMRYSNKLFNLFQRLHRQEDFEGTGVGLAIVQRVVQKHGGRIWAKAEPDKGATFYFTLAGLGRSDAERIRALEAS